MSHILEQKWVFEPHGGFGSNDPDGNPYPFGYISAGDKGEIPSPIFELHTVSEIPPDHLIRAVRKMIAAPDLLTSGRELANALDAVVPSDAAIQHASLEWKRIHQALKDFRRAAGKAVGAS